MIAKLGLAAAAVGGLLTAHAGTASAHEDCYRQGDAAPAYTAPVYQAPVYQVPVYQAPVAAPAYNGYYYYGNGSYAPRYAPVVYGRGPHWRHFHRPFRRW